MIVIPETQSQEKKDMLRLCGAELIEVPAVPYSNPNNYVKLSGRLAEQLAKTEPNGAIWANQFDNVANRQGHVETTGPEIWRQTDGKVDGFVLRGRHRRHARRRRHGAQGAQPERAHRARRSDGRRALQLLHDRQAEVRRLLDHRRHRPGPHHQEPRRRADRRPPIRFPTTKRVPIMFDLLEHEGLCLGGSSGINVAGAVRLAKELGPGHTIVTILADYGTRYQSKLFNPEFLREKNLPVPAWLERSSHIKLPFA